jgi:hypothetical protein
MEVIDGDVVYFNKSVSHEYRWLVLKKRTGHRPPEVKVEVNNHGHA